MSTSLIRRNSFAPLNPWRLLEETESRMWDWLTTPSGYTPLGRMANRELSYAPPIDVFETEHEVWVVASLPGIQASSVDVRMENGLLTVAGEQKPFQPNGETEGLRQHLAGIPRYGSFTFTVTLPVEVVAEQAQAKYEDGLLQIRFPKPERAKPIRIAINGVAAEQPAIEEAQPSKKGK